MSLPVDVLECCSECAPLRHLNRLIDLTFVVTNLFVSGICVQECKMDAQEQKLSVILYRKNRHWGERYNKIRYIESAPISLSPFMIYQSITTANARSYTRGSKHNTWLHPGATIISLISAWLSRTYNFWQ